MDQSLLNIISVDAMTVWLGSYWGVAELEHELLITEWRGVQEEKWTQKADVSLLWESSWDSENRHRGVRKGLGSEI